MAAVLVFFASDNIKKGGDKPPLDKTPKGK
jgi:hypothetical protein